MCGSRGGAANSSSGGGGRSGGGVLQPLRSVCSCLCGRLTSRWNNLNMENSRDDIKSMRFWQAVGAELFATTFFVFFGCGAWIEADPNVENEVVRVLRVSLTFGLLALVLTYCIMHISGAHLNPSVTLAMLATCRVSFARGLLYIVAQFLGSIIGAALLSACTPDKIRGVLGATVTAENMSAEQGFAVELFATHLLIFCFFGSIDKTAKGAPAWSGPCVLGLALTALHLFAVPLTGASFNTARSFGPALVGGAWKHHWIYWFGPLLGGVTGALAYEFIFATEASLARAKACLFSNQCTGDQNRHSERRSSVAKDAEPEEMVALRTSASGSVKDLKDVEQGDIEADRLSLKSSSKPGSKTPSIKGDDLDKKSVKDDGFQEVSVTAPQ